jgi:hypothetical protein
MCLPSATKVPLPHLTYVTPQHILNVIFGERESEAIGLHIRGGSPPPCPQENLGCCCANVAGVAEVFFPPAALNWRLVPNGIGGDA